jgi:hypothetical protein
MSYPFSEHAVISMHELMPEIAQKRMSYPISEHAGKLILAETVLNFYALACTGAYSKV